MNSGKLASVPTYGSEELARAAHRATDLFVERRVEEGSEIYEDFFHQFRSRLQHFFQRTASLRNLRSSIFEQDASWLYEARYLAGPPISADDLRTLVGHRLGGRRLDSEVALRVVEVILEALDPFRFPWVSEGREPTDEECERARAWTAGLMAVERVRTFRRTESSRVQEHSVKVMLQGSDYTQVERPASEIFALDDLERGTFTDEIRLAGVKVDVPVRLYDGRLLAIECKVSNSAVNSIKRLNREVGNKAEAWRRAYGSQVIPCAVISGVFDVSCLSNAQEQGIFVVWDHQMEVLANFIGR